MLEIETLFAEGVQLTPTLRLCHRREVRPFLKDALFTQVGRLARNSPWSKTHGEE
jgi:hypothetical protein